MTITKKPVVWAETGISSKPSDVKIAEGWTGVPPEQPFFEWFNWVVKSDQENINLLIDQSNVYFSEISNLIAASGLLPDLSPTGPGDQMFQSVFTEEALTVTALSDSAVETNKIKDNAVVDDKLGDDLDLGHFDSGTLNIRFPTTGDVYESILLNHEVLTHLDYTDESNGDYTRSTVNPGQISLQEFDTSAEVAFSTSVVEGLSVGNNKTAGVEYRSHLRYNLVENSVETGGVTESQRFNSLGITSETDDGADTLYTRVSPEGVGSGGSKSPIGADSTFMTTKHPLPSDMYNIPQTWQVAGEIYGRILHPSPVATQSLNIPSEAIITSVSVHFTDAFSGLIHCSPGIPEWELTGGKWGINKIYLPVGDLITPDIGNPATKPIVLQVTYETSNAIF